MTRQTFPGVEVRKVNMTPYNSNQPPHGLARETIDYRQLLYYRVIGEHTKGGRQSARLRPSVCERSK
jgi:hypothetical protein